MSKLSNLTLANVVDSMFCTVITNENANILYISQNYCDILGVTKEEIEGKHVSEIIPTSRIPIVAHTKQAEIGYLFELANGQNTVCNRIPIWDGDVFKGVISNAAIANVTEVEALNRKIDKLRKENLKYKNVIQSIKTQSFNEIIGNSQAMQQIKNTISSVANTNMTVLITGETGTGKEVFANAIHNLSNRYNHKFVKINCAAIPKDLLESELFGYEGGAFSGANKNGKPGKFELANHGSLLLDEIGEMPMQLQSKLLRVLQEKEMERIGGVKPIKLNMRIICNTNQNIEGLIAQGLFRRDLYYRINVMEINIPPLRERKEDIEPLCAYLIEKINNKYGFSVTGLTDEVFSQFIDYDWEGNVRELEHVLERACLATISGEIKLENIGFFMKRSNQFSQEYNDPAEAEEAKTLQDVKYKAEKEKIIKTLKSVNGNKALAARILEIDRKALYNKLKKYEL